MIEVDPKLFINCRLCLEDLGTYQIDPSIREQISYCFEINVELYDGLPQLICKKCQLILSDYAKTKRSFIGKQDELKKQQHSAILSTEITEKQDWKKEYQKIFVCRMCDLHYTSLKSVERHKVKHKHLKTKHTDVHSDYCVVKMSKIDDKPNITGSTDQVVFSKNKIIAKGNSDYYIAYIYVGHNSTNTSANKSVNQKEDCNLDENSDSLGRKRRRISSKSSNETVVIENYTLKKSQENECIRIDDTDSDDGIKKNQKTKVTNKNSIHAKMGAVAKLINTARDHYLKKHEKPKRPSLEQLNRKMISIGRQIINKRNFNSTCVMKYMEHLNLNVIWLSRSPLDVTNDSNYLKINPRLRNVHEKNINDFAGFQKKYEKPIELNRPMEKSGLNVSPGLNTTGYTDTRKLLNSYPVANPKQLPKKFNSDAKKDKSKCVANMPTLEVNVNELAEVTSSGFENNMIMPVTTFTTSLAISQDQNILNDKENSINNGSNSNNLVVNTISNSIPVNSSSENPKPAPRIKVKSVTELLSTETLNRMNQRSAPETLNQQLPQNGANIMSSSPHASYNCDDFILFDTVELPTTKTSSPFNYFRTLLQVQNICLLDTDVTLSADFNTLIKFKVHYRQPNKDQPVILCLSLFCSNNTFCIKIKDINGENINLTKISANWQWEILKIYCGEVVPKLLNNAQRISSEVREYTNRFLCLLKSLKRM